ncbi:Uncharacterised protein [Mycobacterium tuberculosis]|nr:Uncharacterised protein [Mycobacterium tuberculosis]
MNCDGGCRAGGVLERIGERLLHGAVRRQLGTLRQGARHGAGDSGEGDGQSGAAALLHKGGHIVERGHRCVGGRLVGAQ